MRRLPSTDDREAHESRSAVVRGCAALADSTAFNVFIFAVILASFAPGLRENTTLLRLARLGRVLRIVRPLPDLRVLTIAIGRSLPGVASLTVLAVLVLFIYGMLGWTIFGDHAPEQYGTIDEAMLTLFVTLTLENLPDQIALGRELSDRLEHGEPGEPVIEERIAKVRDALDRLEADVKGGRV